MRRVMAWLAALILGLIGIAVVPAPAQAHSLYSGCVSYNDLGAEWWATDDLWTTYYTLKYTVPSNSSCNDVNVTHIGLGTNRQVPVVVQYQCHVFPPGQPGYTGNWFTFWPAGNPHQWIVPCVGMPNGWQFRVYFKVRNWEPGPLYFGMSY